MANESPVAHPRRWPRRLLIGVNVFVALCLVFTGVTYAYLKWQFGKVDKVALCEVLRNCGDDDPGQPMNVLLVGSDSREQISADEAEQFGDQSLVGGERSDTIIVLHVDPRSEKAALMSIPRDLSVVISDGKSTSPRRINSAFEKGPQVLIATIKDQLGIEIDHYAQVDFNTFRGLVDAIGGVSIYFPSPARDKKSGLNVANPGCVKMDGNTALSYVRSRNYEYFESGKWRIDPTADLGRIERQQSFIRRVLGKASKVGRNPVRLNSIISSAVPNVKIDDAFSTKDILRLAKRFHSLEPEAVEMLPLPTVGTRERGASVLKLKQPEASQIIDRLIGKAPPPADPAGAAAPPKVLPGTVRVRVLNGTGADGQAGDAAKALARADFGVAGTGDAPSASNPQTVIRYGKGQLPKAQLLQAYVDGRSRLVEDGSLKGGDLVLTTGSGFVGVKDAPGASPATTATTAAKAAATAAPTTTGARAPVAPSC
ncbi:MAG TPA: LCP family protein [Acidimicrobiales bacterium]|nr:LCP family protein [Acidimicrobiales bacterium]